MVIWLLGISGAGKTTLGVKLKEHLKAQQKRVAFIDGDLVRRFYDNDLGYSEEDRRTNIKRIHLAAQLLDEAGVLTIVCNISPYEDLRDFCRSKIKGYTEIYLKRSVESCQRHDVKSIYAEHKGKQELVGLDQRFDEPGKSDLILDIDHETVEESFTKLIVFLQKKYPDVF